MAVEISIFFFFMYICWSKYIPVPNSDGVPASEMTRDQLEGHVRRLQVTIIFPPLPFMYKAPEEYL
jgi:hypothetical protein